MAILSLKVIYSGKQAGFLKRKYYHGLVSIAYKGSFDDSPKG